MQINRIAVCVVLIALGTVLIVFGVANGDVDEVLQKSIRVCLECVGIG